MRDFFVMGHRTSYEWFIHNYGMDRKLIQHLPSSVMKLQGRNFYPIVYILGDSAYGYSVEVMQFLRWRGAKFFWEDELKEALLEWLET